MKKYTIYKGCICEISSIYYVLDVFEDKYYNVDDEMIFDTYDDALKYLCKNVHYNIGDHVYVEQNMWEAKEFVIESINECYGNCDNEYRKTFKLQCVDKDYSITVTNEFMFKHKSWCLYKILYECLEDIKEINHQKKSFEIIKNKVLDSLNQKQSSK